MELQVFALLLCFSINGVYSQIVAENTSEKNRTYKFGFDLLTQHRQEMKDEKGIITGEYGFISADGYYRSVEYATDEQGRFIILNQKQERVTLPEPVVGTSSSIVDAVEEENRREKLKVDSAAYSTATEKVKIYQFNYTALHTPDSREHGHQEMGFSDSSKMGDYYWDGPDGYRRIVSYVANDGGFVPVLRQVPIEV